MNSLRLTLFLFLGCLLAATASAQDKARPKPPKPKPVDIRSFSGEYTFNPSCTDEMATVHVTFRKAREGEHGAWKADGALDNSFHGTAIEFTGAFVEMGKDGSVTVDAQFFAFKLTGKELEWLPGYPRTLYKVVDGVLQDGR